jgi:BirA family transcriptional regulator, biotin operon repressor / biotin---[acetyl-CoA-carboxylase] ligase
MGPIGTAVAASPVDWGPVAVDPRVAAAVRAAPLVTGVRHVGRVGSTQDEVRRGLADGDGPGWLLVADAQSVGRGRHGRRWEDGPGPLASLRASIALVPPPGPPGWVPLAVGLAVRDAVAGLLGTPTPASASSMAGTPAPARPAVAVKWPNDVVLIAPGASLVVASKCAGVLVERQGDAASCIDVVGVGIDLDWRDADVTGDDARTQRRWVSVAESTDVAPDPVGALVGLIEGLDRWVGALARGGTDAARVIDEVRHACATIGQSVTVVRPGGATITGRASDLDGQGRLVVTTGGGDVTVDAGEVTLAPDASLTEVIP